MKFTVNRKTFIKQFENVQKTIPTKVPTPILIGVLMKIENEELTLTGGTSDVFITEKITNESGLKDLEDGAVVVKAKFVRDVIKQATDETVTFESIDDNVMIHLGDSKFTIEDLEASSFPHSVKLIHPKKVILPVSNIRLTIDRVLGTTSKLDSRPILKAIHFNIDGDRFNAVSTDSHRLNRDGFALDDSVKDPMEFNLENDRLKVLMKVLDKKQSKVTLYIDDAYLLFSTETQSIWIRLTEGIYPETDRLIPKSFEFTFDGKAKDFLRALKHLQVIVKNSPNTVVKLQMNNQHIVLTANAIGFAQGEETLKTTNATQEDFEISFNPSYVIDALKLFKDEEVRFGFNTTVDPFTIEAINSDNELIGLITPVRTF
ncbi:DNA polymerase III subunit beta [Pediococcus pentosaceus]|uniref:DNA polymerase III subunit beta n=1 Tax=Pediococcus pentosaceus TaxID=1255 RepID=UPI0011B7B355|nr:DNA polymerase III subunit beta [Pediococcus pentosaceus]QDZ69524.1 DNA polymerase III subunit beta [Pediococcus pentosaceus]QYY85570.1 DNA polymerase III subunit beta [Pediococcus pentosaceus]